MTKYIKVSRCENGWVDSDSAMVFEAGASVQILTGSGETGLPQLTSEGLLDVNSYLNTDGYPEEGVPSFESEVDELEFELMGDDYTGEGAEVGATFYNVKL